MFAKVRIIAEKAGDGALLLHSADELGGYPATVLHSMRAWAAADPDYPLVAERGPGGGWRVVMFICADLEYKVITSFSKVAILFLIYQVLFFYSLNFILLKL